MPESHWSFGVIIGGVLGKARKQLAISSIVLGCLVALVSSVTYWRGCTRWINTKYIYY